MQKFIRIFSKEYSSVNQAALLMGAFTFLSQILALFRDRFIAHFIGPSAELDAYYMAFRIPDFLFISIASLVSISVLIPFILEKMSKDGGFTEDARNFLNRVFSVFFLSLSVVVLVAFLLMPVLVNFIAPGFSAEMRGEAVLLSRIMLLSPLFLGLSNFFGTITQIFRKFFLFSLSPVFYNVGIIIGAVFFYRFFGIKGLVLGVVLGAVLHFLTQFFSARECGFKPRFTKVFDWVEVKKIISVSLPRTLGLSFNNIALIVIISFASFLKSGSISVFNLSYNLQSVPLNIIGISYAVAAFPTLARSFGFGNKSEFREHLAKTARQIVFWSLPTVFLFIVLRAQIVRVILGSPSFSWDNTRLVAASLAIFAISVVAQGLIALISRAYYAAGNTRKPLLINFISSLFIIFLAYGFIHLYENFIHFKYFIESLLKVGDIPGTEILMLPLAYSLGTILNSLLQLFFAKRDFMEKNEFVSRTFFQSLGASFLAGFSAYVCLNIFSGIFDINTFLGIFSQGFFAGIVGILVGLLTLFILKSPEFFDLLAVFKKKLWNSRIIISPQEEL